MFFHTVNGREWEAENIFQVKWIDVVECWNTLIFFGGELNKIDSGEKVSMLDTYNLEIIWYYKIYNAMFSVLIERAHYCFDESKYKLLHYELTPKNFVFPKKTAWMNSTYKLINHLH